MNRDKQFIVAGQLGFCGHRRVFCGFAAAGDLAAASYADVLDDHGRGYQRRMSREHSLEFKRYIQTDGATSIPLTFNLRDSDRERWKIDVGQAHSGAARLIIDLSCGPVLTQVDGQHRLGFMQASPIQFAFMTYLGLSEPDEREVFATINGKAKGLSGSLLDFVQAKSLGSDLATLAPPLFIALGLNTDTRSPWCGRLDLGGSSTVGNKRVASLRTMHKAASRFVKEASPRGDLSAEVLLEHAIAFWRALAIALPEAWGEPRRHMIVKGIGVYSLMSLAGLMVREAQGLRLSTDWFLGRLTDFVDQIDWSNTGPLEGYGGAKGAEMALKMILEVRRNARARIAQNA